jgi:hypothetical protein
MDTSRSASQDRGSTWPVVYQSGKCHAHSKLRGRCSLRSWPLPCAMRFLKLSPNANLDALTSAHSLTPRRRLASVSLVTHRQLMLAPLLGLGERGAFQVKLYQFFIQAHLAMCSVVQSLVVIILPMVRKAYIAAMLYRNPDEQQNHHDFVSMFSLEAVIIVAVHYACVFKVKIDLIIKLNNSISLCRHIS